MDEMLIFPSKFVAEKTKTTLLFHIWIVEMEKFHGKVPLQSADTTWTLKWFSEDEMSKMAESGVWSIMKDLWYLCKIARLG